MEISEISIATIINGNTWQLRCPVFPAPPSCPISELRNLKQKIYMYVKVRGNILENLKDQTATNLTSFQIT